MMVRVDGSEGEGGGQVLRTSVSLAALLGCRVEVANVRAKRSRPGLQPQHLAAVRAAAALCDAELEGAAVGSSALSFNPRAPVRAGEYRFDIGTAGSAGLVAQTVLLPLALAAKPSRVSITGGTHLPHAPPADYLASVYAHALARFAGLAASVEMQRSGFYPRGGGAVALEIAPSTLRPFELIDRGSVRDVQAWVLSARLPAHVAERGRDAFTGLWASVGVSDVTVETRTLDALGPGAAVGVSVVCERGAGGFVAVGEKGKPIEQVAADAVGAFARWWESGAACDEHLADQLVLPAVLAAVRAGGESAWTTSRVTEHLRTVLGLVERFVPVEATVAERTDGTGAVRVRVRSSAERVHDAGGQTG